MAAAAGIDVPRTQLLGKTKRSPGYFAIDGSIATARSGFILILSADCFQVPHGYPGTGLWRLAAGHAQT